ncbi:hypothetical protein TSAR_012439 [Trichomalopsis sarcophagae]|uniref:Reverse transcriptase domain-containing protein n=1 Tax=Trichomalopsis sarcophagae TaxID=543379 RepID=A0A232EKH2_9HYME|nr:hypothetical protein TSAR_012439 [Trichomalopsis sarcophagae]
MHEQVYKMLHAGIIRRSKSNWSSSVVMVLKSDGSFRFCVDYRKVNAIPLTERSIPITAFTVRGLGLFKFVRMPYGLAGGPATFQMLANKLITPEMESFAFAYLDDIIIETDTFSDHIKWLTLILKRINKAGLTINRKKSKICMSEVRYIGVLMNREGCRPNSEQNHPIVEYPASKNLK